MYSYTKNLRLAFIEYFICVFVHVAYAYFSFGQRTAVWAALGFVPFLIALIAAWISKSEKLVIRFFYISVIVSSCYLGNLLGTISMMVLIFSITAILVAMFIRPKLLIEYVLLTIGVLIILPLFRYSMIQGMMAVELYLTYVIVYAVGTISLLFLVNDALKYRILMEEMTDEASRAVEVKSNFLANMSHEIRTPMNGIIGMAEMAIRGNIPKEEKEYLYQIRASGNSLLSIINDILDFSKIESGKLEIIEAEYSTMELINEITNIMNARIGNKNVELIVEVDPNIPRQLYGDDIRIRQVILNLANNAIKFTREGAVTLVLNSYRTQDGVDLYVAVEDTGIGIRKEDIEKLFESFQQVDTKRNRHMEGSGLGLAISRQLIQLMGGELMVESIYEKGSEFHFMIHQKVAQEAPAAAINNLRTMKVIGFFYNPYVKESFHNLMSRMTVTYKECNRIEQLINLLQADYTHVVIEQECFTEKVQSLLIDRSDIECILVTNLLHMAEEESWYKVLKKPLYCLNVIAAFNHEDVVEKIYRKDEFFVPFVAPSARVLVVDDNTVNLRVAKGLLAPFQVTVDLCTNGWEALKLVEANYYDMIFMDHMMPEMDGIEVTHHIREKGGKYFEQIPIIAFTANVINGVIETFLEAGMDDFMAKPIEVADIETKLKKWLPEEKISLVQELRLFEIQEDGYEEWDDRELGIEGIDSAKAIEMLGDRELYLDTLAEYYELIPEKYDKLLQFEVEENLHSYTIEVHGLKGISNMIGAFELGELADKLEKFGRLGDMASIHKYNGDLLKKFKNLQKNLSPYTKN